MRTISLRRYDILMQLFMLLYSGRNAVVHPMSNFFDVSPGSVGEGTDFENAFFFKSDVRFLKFFTPPGRFI